ncbi:hypothetical protein [Actinoplanes subtropicus]|uniref:hypothetical protein n=1 Tax=Actinoplanes subtropicus TaxID=543632 RepID=UPI0004C3A297|nr:hypothetical protein [Actinoplanes subtropicus]
MSDTPRDQDDDDAPTGEISIGRSVGDADGPGSGDADGPGSGDPSGPRSGDPSGPRSGDPSGPGSAGAGGSGAGDTGDAATTAASAAGKPRRLLSFGPLPATPGDPRHRRRRRWFGTGLAVAAAILLVALCAGALSVISAVNGVRDRAADARTARALRENDCLDLEKRLNRLVPPGSTTGPAARATAIRDENAAVRIYVDQLATQRDEDAWRQLLDARTVFADALDRQAKSRTPAFFVAPRTDNGLAVADQLIQWSPAPCAGAIRRLAAPEL